MGGFSELLKHMLLQALVVTLGLERLLNKSTHISQLMLLPALSQYV